MSDFISFIDSAVWILNGEYRSLYPLPLVYIFIPFTVLPPLWGYIILSCISIMLLVAGLKTNNVIQWLLKSTAWIFYVPVLQTLYLGQIDIIIWWLINKKNPITLAFATLKPHLFLVFGLHVLFEKKKDFKFLSIFILSCLLIYLPFFLIRPMWVMEWVNQVAVGRMGTNQFASLWAAPIMGLAILPMLFNKKLLQRLLERYRGMFLMLSPGIQPYDYSMFTNYSYWLIPASWIVQYLINMFEAPWPSVLLGILYLYL